MRKLAMWRISFALPCSFALASGQALVAQTRSDTPAAREPVKARAWSIAATASLTSFHGAASMAAPSSTDDATSITVRPSQGIALDLAAARQWHTWTVSVGVSYLPTRVEAVSSDVAVQDRTKDLERVRFTLTLARHLVRIGTGRLEVRAGPTLDDWSADGEDGRTVPGGTAALALQLPAGPITLEHVLGFSWSPGPFRAAELPDGYTRQSLRAVSIGVGIRRGL